MDDAVATIAATGVDVIAYCDMVTTFIMEAGWNENAVERIQERTGIATLSAWTALRDALAHIGARRIALGTPYPSAIHALAPPFFAERGFELRSHATLDIIAMRDVPTVDQTQLEAFVRTLDISGCDAIVLLATDLPTFACLDALEAALGLPILSSNQTLLWRALSWLGCSPAAPLGRLFRICQLPCARSGRSGRDRSPVAHDDGSAQARQDRSGADAHPVERHVARLAELVLISNSHGPGRIDDHEIGVGADLQCTFSRVESEQPRRRRAAGAHEARIVE